jgi:hypothetical protein
MIEFKHEHIDLYGKSQSEITYVSHSEGLDEVVQDFRNFLLAIGYQPESVDRYIEVD